MNSGQRIAIVVGAVVILAVGFVLAQGSGDEGGRESERSAGEAQVSPQEEAANTETSTGTGGTAAPEGDDERVERIRIRDGKPASGDAETLTYESGDTVRLAFVAESGAAEVHLHGYDKELEVPAGATRTLEFTADAEGIFEIEDHDTEALLARLEVRP